MQELVIRIYYRFRGSDLNKMFDINTPTRRARIMNGSSLRSTIMLLLLCCAVIVSGGLLIGCKGSDGGAGAAGANGTDGTDGTNGRDAITGVVDAKTFTY